MPDVEVANANKFKIFLGNNAQDAFGVIYVTNETNQTITPLNEMGSAIWRLLMENVDGISSDEICDTFVIAFPDEDKTVMLDQVNSNIKILHDACLIYQS